MRRIAGAVLALTLALVALSARAESLRDIYEQALANDAQLKADEAQYRANLETERLQRSGLLPQLEANYDYTETDQTVVGESFTFGDDAGGGDGVTTLETHTDTDTTEKGYQITLSQPLFDLPAWFSFQSGKEFTKQAEATFAANQQDLILRVVEAYLAVLRAQDNLEASRAQERAFNRQLEQTQQRFEVGLIAVTDVYEAQAARDLAEVNRITDENNVSVALERLSVLTGKDHGSVHLLKEDFSAQLPQPADRAAWVDFALENNFNLQAARHAEEVARQTARANKMEHAPRITGTYNYNDYDTDGTLTRRPTTGFDTSPNQELEDSSWRIRLHIPLYSGGAVSSNRRRAAEEFNVARENRINLTRNTITDARSLHMTVVSDVSRVAARAQAIVSSRSALDATQAGYEVGTRNVVDVLNAQNTLFAAQRDYANSRYDYIINSLRLKEAAGLLSPEDVYDLNEALQEPPPPTATGTP
ncbi:TolC family outer membrane protein [Kineobactrum salinum]|uniref:TolC family outer membrane protein n=1 Tax=Kineobactrum salinum TaxID=2708301 RepID=A0A6C0U2R6_9GAMM|nr:TolC family outer membrane protein [Kineobactrum salinum]QIB65739.1 TolC family outer membrane protein [Kineobactrum salinum]